MAFQTGGLHHLGIRVTDLGRARQFYVDTLGFQQILELPGLVLVNAHGTLMGIRGAAPASPAGDRFDPYRVGLDHLALAVANAGALEELRSHLDAAGVRWVQLDSHTPIEDWAPAIVKAQAFADATHRPVFVLVNLMGG